MATFGKGTLYINGKAYPVEDFKVETGSSAGEPHAPSAEDLKAEITGTFTISKVAVEKLRGRPRTLSELGKLMIANDREVSRHLDDDMISLAHTRLSPWPKGAKLAVDIEAGPAGSAAFWIASAGGKLTNVRRENGRRWWAIDPAQTNGTPRNEAFDLEAMKAALTKFTAPELGVPWPEFKFDEPLLRQDGLFDYQRAMMDKLAQATGIDDRMVFLQPANVGKSMPLTLSHAFRMYQKQRRDEMRALNEHIHEVIFKDWLHGLFRPRLSHIIAKIYNKENDYGNPRIEFAASVVSAVWHHRQGVDVPALARRIVVPSVGTVPRRPPYRAGGSAPDRRGNRKSRNQ